MVSFRGNLKLFYPLSFSMRSSSFVISNLPQIKTETSYSLSQVSFNWENQRNDSDTSWNFLSIYIDMA